MVTPRPTRHPPAAAGVRAVLWRVDKHGVPNWRARSGCNRLQVRRAWRELFRQRRDLQQRASRANNRAGERYLLPRRTASIKLAPHVNPSLSAQQAFKQLGLKRSEIVVSSKVFFGSGGACWRGRRQGAVGAAFATLCAHLWCPLACRQQRAHRQGPLSEAYRGRNQRCGACEGAASRPHPQHIAAGAAHACWCSPTLPRASPVQRTYLDSLSYPSHVSLTPLL